VAYIVLERGGRRAFFSRRRESLRLDRPVLLRRVAAASKDGPFAPELALGGRWPPRSPDRNSSAASVGGACSSEPGFRFERRPSCRRGRSYHRLANRLRGCWPVSTRVLSFAGPKQNICEWRSAFPGQGNRPLICPS